MRRRLKWTAHNLDKLNKVQEILRELDAYKPLTLRQVYYQLVGKGFIENKSSQYTMLSTLLKWARIDGYIAWADIEDRVRVHHSAAGWNDEEHFIEQELSRFLSGYRRDLLQTQDRYIEVWIEKDALSSVFRRVADPYCISTVVCRGFSSVSFLKDFRDRLEYHPTQEPVMLYFGDFDPSGVEMLHSMQETLVNELDCRPVEFKRVALLREDIFEYRLPNNPDALKKTDTRAQKHLEMYGELAVELDALPPSILEERIREAIGAELDLNAFVAEQEIHARELDKLNHLQAEVWDFVRNR